MSVESAAEAVDDAKPSTIEVIGFWLFFAGVVVPLATLLRVVHGIRHVLRRNYE